MNDLAPSSPASVVRASATSAPYDPLAVLPSTFKEVLARATLTEASLYKGRAQLPQVPEESAHLLSTPYSMLPSLTLQEQQERSDYAINYRWGDALQGISNYANHRGGTTHITCCCGQADSLSYPTMRKREHNGDSPYYAPFTNRAPGHIYCCAHITAQLRPVLPGVYKAWQQMKAAVATRAYHTSPDAALLDAGMEMAMFDKAVGLLAFARALPVPSGNTPLVLTRVSRTHALHMSQWQWLPPHEKHQLASKVQTQRKLEKSLRNRFASLQQRRGYDVSWENFEAFFGDIIKTLPEDFEPHRYRMTVLAPHGERITLKDIRWDPVSKGETVEGLPSLLKMHELVRRLNCKGPQLLTALFSAGFQAGLQGAFLPASADLGESLLQAAQEAGLWDGPESEEDHDLRLERERQA